MGRVANFRFGAGVVLVALIAMLALFARGSSVTEASTFSPVSTLNVANPTPGAASDITGNTFSLAKLGAFNAFCGILTFPAVGPFLEATTGTWSAGVLTSPTVVFEDTDADGRGEWFDSGFDFSSNPGTNALAIRAAVTRYPAN